jgi:hypothetical protein
VTFRSVAYVKSSIKTYNVFIHEKASKNKYIG